MCGTRGFWFTLFGQLLHRVSVISMVCVLAMMACVAVTVPFLVLVAVKILAMDMEMETLQSKLILTLPTFYFSPLSLLAFARQTLSLTLVDICRKVLLQRQHVLVHLAGWNLHATILKGNRFEAFDHCSLLYE